MEIKKKYCIEKLKKFLSDNKITEDDQKCILKKASNCSIVNCIDYGISWFASEYAYYFWVCLQLKWVVALIKDRENCGFDLLYLVDMLKKYNKYFSGYNISNIDKTVPPFFSKNEIYYRKSKYQYIYNRYSEYIKFHDEEFG